MHTFIIVTLFRIKKNFAKLIMKEACKQEGNFIGRSEAAYLVECGGEMGEMIFLFKHNFS